MSENIKSKMISKINSSSVFALQLVETTYVSNLSQLLMYIRYVVDESINEEFLFCQSLETTAKAAGVFQVLSDFFDKTELSWSKLVKVCTDGAPAMISANSRLVSVVKQKIQLFNDSKSGVLFQNHFEKTSRAFACCD